FYTTSGNPELHSGLPCGAALGVPAALTLSFVPTMCPPAAASPAISSGRCVPVPMTSGRTGAASGGKFKKFKKCHFFFSILSLVFLSCALPAFCLFFL
ncbi:unnamed protein product, partial [Staurois parvus]